MACSAGYPILALTSTDILVHMSPDDFLIGEFLPVKQSPFPYFVGDNIFNREILKQVLDNFPSDNDPLWEGRTWEKKQYGFSVEQLHPVIQETLKVLSSTEIRDKLQDAFNTPKLYAVMAGASAHITGAWEKNTMHTDWQMYGHRLFRWLNLHIFLNEDYRPEHEGELVLGDTNTKIQPYFGNTVVFLSTNLTKHGQIQWKRDDSRKSLAVFYFAEKPNPHFKRQLTYVDRGENECDSIIASQQ